MTDILVGNLSPIGSIGGKLTGHGTLSGTLLSPQNIGSVYTGPFEFTPGDGQVIIRTEGTYVPNDILVNPVPSNYGLITWNGLYLTVS